MSSPNASFGGLSNQLKTVVLLGALSALLIGIGGALSPSYLWLFAILAIAMNVGTYFWSDRLVLMMHRARPIARGDDPGLFAIVEELAARAELPMPKVYLIDDSTPNAFATGRNPAHGVVAVTRGIRSLLSDRELRGVLAHELAHIKNRDILIATIAATVASVISMIATALRWGLIFGGDRRDRDDNGGLLGTLALAIVAPIAATVIQLAISRSREYQADATGARIAGDPLALASALGKLERGNRRSPLHTGTEATASLFIVAPLSGSSIASWFSTHPPLAERIRRLEAIAGQAPVARGNAVSLARLSR
jgi:heat shock protein HtpX